MTFSKAFSIIELTVVIIIITILVLAIVPMFAKTVDSAKKRDAKSTLNIIRGAEILYHADNAVYYEIASLNNDARGALNMDVYNNSDWQYTVGLNASSATATATRQTGKHKNDLITIDIATGNIINEYTW